MATSNVVARRAAARTAVLVASGDLREEANRVCWPAQQAMEKALTAAFARAGWKLARGHAPARGRGHGFIASCREGLDVFAGIDPQAPLVAADDFASPSFERHLKAWLDTRTIHHDTNHVVPFEKVRVPRDLTARAAAIADELRLKKALMGVFDEGCMGMENAIIPDRLLHATGVFKERLSQSALFHETMRTSEAEGRAVVRWLEKAGMRFHFGRDEATDLTRQQVLLQCRMYIAALRIADRYGCDLVGIQYQQGLKDLLPASDLVEGMLNDSKRPPVTAQRGGRVRGARRPAHRAGARRAR